MEVHGGDELDALRGRRRARARRWSPPPGCELDCDCVVDRRGRDARRDARALGRARARARPAACAARPGLESSVPGVFAAGDNCEYDSPVHGRRLRRRALGRGRQPGQDGRAQHARARGGRTTWCPTSSPTSPTGRRSSTWARGRASRWCAARWTRASSPCSSIDGGRVTAALAVGRSDDLEHARRFIVDGSPRDARRARRPRHRPAPRL